MGCRPTDCRTLPLVLPDVPNSRLVVLVPEAEPVVGHLRDRWDANAGDGVAAHVTVVHAGTDRSELLVRRRIQSAQSAVNQIELHPFFPQAEQRAANADRGIVTEAWCPIGRAGALLDHLLLRSIGDRHGVSAAQVVLRWHVQLGVVPIPKSASDERQYENLDVFGFTLTDEEMDQISALGRVDGRLRGLDPATHEEQ